MEALATLWPGVFPPFPARLRAGADRVCFCLGLSRLAPSSSPGKCSRICGGRGRPRAFLPGFVPACPFIIPGQMQSHLRGPGQTACVFVCVCPGLPPHYPRANAVAFAEAGANHVCYCLRLSWPKHAEACPIRQPSAVSSCLPMGRKEASGGAQPPDNRPVFLKTGWNVNTMTHAYGPKPLEMGRTITKYAGPLPYGKRPGA